MVLVIDDPEHLVPRHVHHHVAVIINADHLMIHALMNHIAELRDWLILVAMLPIYVWLCFIFNIQSVSGLSASTNTIGAITPTRDDYFVKYNLEDVHNNNSSSSSDGSLTPQPYHNQPRISMGTSNLTKLLQPSTTEVVDDSCSSHTTISPSPSVSNASSPRDSNATTDTDTPNLSNLPRIPSHKSLKLNANNIGHNETSPPPPRPARVSNNENRASNIHNLKKRKSLTSSTNGKKYTTLEAYILNDR